VAAGRSSSLSTWVNAALAERVAKEQHLRALAEAVAGYEAEFGVISAAELVAQQHEDHRTSIAVRAPRKSLPEVTGARQREADPRQRCIERCIDRARTQRSRDVASPQLALIAAQVPLSHGGIVGQAWRGPGPTAARLSSARRELCVQLARREYGAEREATCVSPRS
jgi:hypothetical protein